MRQLEQAKTAFPNTHLIVGVTGDKATHQRKGLTVLSGTQRAETVRHCRWVDEVIEDCPWIVDTEFLNQHKIDYVAHDDIPYGAAEGDDIYAAIKKEGKFLVTQRTEGVSTTGIITTIVRDYEQYVGRQLKRGTSRQELNVSWLKKNEIDLKRHVAELRDSIRTNWSTTGQELSRELKGIWDRSRPASPAPSMRRVQSNEQMASMASGQKSPTSRVSAVAHLGHLDIPRSPTSPGDGNRDRSNDFATGYTLGLMGGIRSWMTRNRRNVLNEGQLPSGEGSEEEDVSGDGGVDEADRGREQIKRVKVKHGTST